MKIRFAKGAFRIGRKQRPKEQPLTATQADRVQQLVASLAPKPAANPTATVKTMPAAVHKAKPTGGRAIVGRELGNLIGEGIAEFAAMLRRGHFAPGGTVRSLVR